MPTAEEIRKKYGIKAPTAAPSQPAAAPASATGADKIRAKYGLTSPTPAATPAPEPVQPTATQRLGMGDLRAAEQATTVPDIPELRGNQYDFAAPKVETPKVSLTPERQQQLTLGPAQLVQKVFDQRVLPDELDAVEIPWDKMNSMAIGFYKPFKPIAELGLKDPAAGKQALREFLQKRETPLRDITRSFNQAGLEAATLGAYPADVKPQTKAGEAAELGGAVLGQLGQVFGLGSPAQAITRAVGLMGTAAKLTEGALIGGGLQAGREGVTAFARPDEFSFSEAAKNIAGNAAEYAAYMGVYNKLTPTVDKLIAKAPKLEKALETLVGEIAKGGTVGAVAGITVGTGKAVIDAFRENGLDLRKMAESIAAESGQEMKEEIIEAIALGIAQRFAGGKLNVNLNLRTNVNTDTKPPADLSTQDGVDDETLRLTKTYGGRYRTATSGEGNQGFDVIIQPGDQPGSVVLYLGSMDNGFPTTEEALQNGQLEQLGLVQVSGQTGGFDANTPAPETPKAGTMQTLNRGELLRMLAPTMPEQQVQDWVKKTNDVGDEPFILWAEREFGAGATVPMPKEIPNTKIDRRKALREAGLNPQEVNQQEATTRQMDDDSFAEYMQRQFDQTPKDYRPTAAPTPTPKVTRPKAEPVDRAKMIREAYPKMDQRGIDGILAVMEPASDEVFLGWASRELGVTPTPAQQAQPEPEPTPAPVRTPQPAPAIPEAETPLDPQSEQRVTLLRQRVPDFDRNESIAMVQATGYMSDEDFNAWVSSQFGGEIVTEAPAPAEAAPVAEARAPQVQTETPTLKVSEKTKTTPHTEPPEGYTQAKSGNKQTFSPKDAETFAGELRAQGRDAVVIPHPKNPQTRQVWVGPAQAAKTKPMTQTDFEQGRMNEIWKLAKEDGAKTSINPTVGVVRSILDAGGKVTRDDVPVIDAEVRRVMNSTGGDARRTAYDVIVAKYVKPKATTEAAPAKQTVTETKPTEQPKPTAPKLPTLNKGDTVRIPGRVARYEVLDTSDRSMVKVREVGKPNAPIISIGRAAVQPTEAATEIKTETTPKETTTQTAVATETPSEPVEEKKEPWQMTKAEFAKAKLAPVQALRDSTVVDLVRTKDNLVGYGKGAPKGTWEDFKADIAQNGVRSPIEVYIDRGGSIEITEGTHRLLAAEELGMSTVPAEVRGDTGVLHKLAVERALAEGKPIPPEVLKDYPDLQEKREEVTPRKTEQTPTQQTQPKKVDNLTQDEVEGSQVFETPSGQRILTWAEVTALAEKHFGEDTLDQLKDMPGVNINEEIVNGVAGSEGWKHSGPITGATLEGRMADKRSEDLRDKYRHGVTAKEEAAKPPTHEYKERVTVAMETNEDGDHWFEVVLSPQVMDEWRRNVGGSIDFSQKDGSEKVRGRPVEGEWDDSAKLRSYDFIEHLVKGRGFTPRDADHATRQRNTRDKVLSEIRKVIWGTDADPHQLVAERKLTKTITEFAKAGIPLEVGTAHYYSDAPYEMYYVTGTKDGKVQVRSEIGTSYEKNPDDLLKDLREKRIAADKSGMPFEARSTLRKAELHADFQQFKVGQVDGKTVYYVTNRDKEPVKAVDAEGKPVPLSRLQTKPVETKKVEPTKEPEKVTIPEGYVRQKHTGQITFLPKAAEELAETLRKDGREVVVVPHAVNPRVREVWASPLAKVEPAKGEEKKATQGDASKSITTLKDLEEKYPGVEFVLMQNPRNQREYTVSVKSGVPERVQQEINSTRDSMGRMGRKEEVLAWVDRALQAKGVVPGQTARTEVKQPASKPDAPKLIKPLPAPTTQKYWDSKVDDEIEARAAKIAEKRGIAVDDDVLQEAMQELANIKSKYAEWMRRWYPKELDRFRDEYYEANTTITPGLPLSQSKVKPDTTPIVAEDGTVHPYYADGQTVFGQATGGGYWVGSGVFVERSDTKPTQGGTELREMGMKFLEDVIKRDEGQAVDVTDMPNVIVKGPDGARVVFELEDGTQVVFNKQYMDRAVKRGYRVKVTTRRNPALLYKGNEVVGLTLPLLEVGTDTREVAKALREARRLAPPTSKKDASQVERPSSMTTPPEGYTLHKEGNKITLSPSEASSALQMLKDQGKKAIALPHPKNPNTRQVWVEPEKKAAPAKEETTPTEPPEPTPDTPQNPAFTGPRPTLPQTTPQPTKPVTRKQIVKYLDEQFAPMRVGFISKVKGALGLYKNREQVIRTQLAEDFPVQSHEIGHYLDDRLQLSDPAYDSELLPMGQPTAPPGSSTDYIRGEGVGEFIRLYITDPAEALKKAPNFYGAFSVRMVGEPEIKAKLDGAQTLVRAWTSQDSHAKLRGIISVNEKGAKRAVDWETMRSQMVEQLAPLERAVKQMAGNLKLKVDENPYELALLARGWAGRAEAFLEYGPMDADFNKVGESYREILQSTPDLDSLREYVVAKRAKELMDKRKWSIEQVLGVGYTVADNDRNIRDLEATYEPIRQRLLKFQDAVLQELVNSGRISAGEAQAMRRMNEDYVPFYRFFDDASGQFNFAGANHLVNVGNPLKSIEGSGRSIIDPLESIVKNTFAIINSATRNSVGRSLLELAEKSQGMGRVVEIADENARENTVNVWRNGEQIKLKLDPNLHRAMLFLDREQTAMWVKILGMPARTLRLGAILNPDFMASNPIADQMTAFINSEYGYVPFVDFIRGWQASSRKGDLFWKWMAAGGAQSQMVSMDRDHLQEELDKLINNGTLGGTLMKAVKPGTLLRTLSEKGETATRMGEFKKGLAQDDTREGILRAALASRDVTIDFARTGSKTKTVNQLSAFFNAGIQGTYKSIREFKAHPGRMTARAVAAYTIPSIILYLINKDNPYYEEKQEWAKDAFFLVPLDWSNGITSARQSKHFLWIPRKHGLAMMFGVLPERMLRAWNEKDPENFDTKFAKRFTQAWLPNTPIPTALLPIFELPANYNLYTDLPIVPLRELRLEPEARFGPYTSEVAKLAGAATNTSPRKWDQLVRTWTGGLGTLLVQTASIPVRQLDRLVDVPNVDSKATLPDRGVSGYPVLRRFLRDLGGTGVGSSYSEFIEKMDQVEQRYNSLPKGPAKERLLKALAPLRKLERDLQELSSTKREVLANSQFSSEQKKRLVEAIDTRMTDIARRALGKGPMPE